MPEQPSLHRLPRLQHLSTPIRATLKADATLLQVVAALHPTPAVAGHPRAEALDHIRAHEGFDRGWYAAPIGWIDAHGNGDFIVSLRSALVDGGACRLFAGCGIVADSDPINEYQETELVVRHAGGDPHARCGGGCRRTRPGHDVGLVDGRVMRRHGGRAHHNSGSVSRICSANAAVRCDGRLRSNFSVIPGRQRRQTRIAGDDRRSAGTAVCVITANACPERTSAISPARLLLAYATR